MVNTKFEAYKIKREIKRSGRDYKFFRPVANKYGEPTEEMEDIGTIDGLYHEQSEHIMVSMNDTTQVRTKKTPSILCLYSDTSSLAIVIGDRVKINGKTLKVTGVINIQEWSIISDISLEVVDNGL